MMVFNLDGAGVAPTTACPDEGQPRYLCHSHSGAVVAFFSPPSPKFLGLFLLQEAIYPPLLKVACCCLSEAPLSFVSHMEATLHLCLLGEEAALWAALETNPSTANPCTDLSDCRWDFLSFWLEPEVCLSHRVWAHSLFLFLLPCSVLLLQNFFSVLLVFGGFFFKSVLK